MDGLIDILTQAQSQPGLYLLLLFAYSILAAIILPIPVEFALVFALGNLPFIYVTAIVIGLGKMVGAWGIFHLGLRVEDNIRRWSKKYKLVHRFVRFCIKFVDKTEYLGLFILLSIPFMSDTIPIYVYSLFNEEGRILKQKYFLITNFLAGIVRAVIFIGMWNAGIHLLS